MKDFLKKQPNKTEQQMSDFYMSLRMMEHSLWSNSAHLCALGIVLGADPEKIGQILAEGDEQIKVYSQKINDTIDQIKKSKKESEKTEADSLSGQSPA